LVLTILDMRGLLLYGIYKVVISLDGIKESKKQAEEARFGIMASGRDLLVSPPTKGWVVPPLSKGWMVPPPPKG
jgi:hypothetical protein